MNLPGIENYDSLKEAHRTWVASAIAVEGHDREVIGFSRSIIRSFYLGLWLYVCIDSEIILAILIRYNDIRADFMERGDGMGDERKSFSERVVM